MRTLDVVVVGAGLAGLTTALRLARGGARVMLVEARQDVGRGVRTTGIFVRRTLEDFEFPPGTLGPPVRRVALYSPRGRRLVIESPHVEYRVGRMERLYRHLLDACWRAGVTCVLRTRLEDVVATSPGSELLLRSGPRAWRVSARFIVGADGARSRVAQWLGLDGNHRWIVGAEEVFEGIPLDGPPIFHCHIDPLIAPGYLAWVVADGDSTHVGVGGYASRFEPAAALAAFRRRVEPALALCRGHVTERRGGLIPVNGLLRQIASPRGLLVGDAAGAVSPLSAGGLDACIRLSEHAARLLLEGLVDGPGALSRYDGRPLRTRFASRLGMRRLLDMFASPMAVEIALAALRTPPLRPLVRHIFFGDGSFPDPQLSGSRTRFVSRTT
ncbi:MAG: NAD(P)/FAD-dependent oxidoreductase [Longimicrobiales bacterium]